MVGLRLVHTVAFGCDWNHALASCEDWLRRAVAMTTLTTSQWGGAVRHDVRQRNAIGATVLINRTFFLLKLVLLSYHKRSAKTFNITHATKCTFCAIQRHKKISRLGTARFESVSESRSSQPPSFFGTPHLSKVES